MPSPRPDGLPTVSRTGRVAIRAAWLGRLVTDEAGRPIAALPGERPQRVGNALLALRDKGVIEPYGPVQLVRLTPLGQKVAVEQNIILKSDPRQPVGV